MSRKTKLTPEVHRAIVRKVGIGAYLKHAAAACGIGERTLHDWLERGEEGGEEPYATFADDVRASQAEHASNLVAVITRSASGGEWKAAAWQLERMYPKVYAQTSRQEIDHKSSDKSMTPQPARIELVAPGVVTKEEG